ncbi:MAG: uridine diphosphate-N-acetylglucosamine-binding protein YvcK [Candidatus Omnitrophica bacterium]|nr:uridine diphosphate-N-acetylglucosamine-binding protein YvcK [Candidatus Omnitrophota bacterium]
MYNKFLLIGSGPSIYEIKEVLSNLALEVEIANVYNEITPRLRKAQIVIFDKDSYLSNPRLLKNILNTLVRSKKDFVVLSSEKSISAVLAAKAAGASDYILKPYNVREVNLRLSAILNNKKIISCVGGGTGLFNLLLGIKSLPAILPISIVSTTDDGGSSGRLRDSFGILPPGDIRRSLVALSNAPEIMNKIIQYRFSKGEGFRGHSFGNLLLTVLSDIEGSMSNATRGVGDILNINGIVYPIASTESILYAKFEDGSMVKGENNIDLCKGRSPELRIKKCWHKPLPKCDINAYSAIINSDIVTIGPGDLYTSVITNLLIKDIRQAIVKSRAKKIYICNLMTKPGETFGYDAFDHISQILRYLEKDCLDYIILADNSKLHTEALLKYAKKGQFPVQIGNLAKIRKLTRASIIITDLSDEQELIRHDAQKIRNQIAKIINGRA